MRLLDTYALYCGAKIDKCHLYETYFPLPFEKYITFQAETPYDSRNYNMWQDVIDMIAPILSRYQITIIQTGTLKETGYQRLVDVRGQTSMHQLAYLIKNSSLHFGPDSFGVHLSSHYDIPIVSIYSISMPEVAGPHFGSSSKHTLFKAYERVGNKKPSYSPKESPKSINTIMPEEIANAILGHLNISERINLSTIHVGNNYSHNTIREILPDCTTLMPFPEAPIDIRADIHYDENLLAFHLNYWQKAVVTTNKPIPSQLLKNFKSHIISITYEITDNDDADFAKHVVTLGIPLVLISYLPDAELLKKKIKYYEFGVINKIQEPDADVVNLLRSKIDKLYYRSNKLIASNGKLYASHADREFDSPQGSNIEYRKAIDSLSLWKDLSFCTFATT